jgi:hypothetical protein
MVALGPIALLYTERIVGVKASLSGARIVKLGAKRAIGARWSGGSAGFADICFGALVGELTVVLGCTCSSFPANF